jgi:hypothetical protein
MSKTSNILFIYYFDKQHLEGDVLHLQKILSNYSQYY